MPTRALPLCLLLFGCEAYVNKDFEHCENQAAQGIYLYTSKGACGCAQIACNAGELCFEGECCDPAVFPECACEASCAPWEECVDGACCNPATEDDINNCGCEGPCDGEREACTLDTADTAQTSYACTCDPEKNMDNNAACACGDPCDGTQGEQCINGVCECNPSSSEAKESDSNCGCSGPCPTGSACNDGECECSDDTKVICDSNDDGALECASEEICSCESDLHIYDADNCGCNGPCGSGDSCDGGECVCDVTQHYTDNIDCGCEGPCDIDMGYDCDGGACVCPSYRLEDNDLCGCDEACDVSGGYTCQGGACLCDPSNLNNTANCNCEGACGYNSYTVYTKLEDDDEDEDLDGSYGDVSIGSGTNTVPMTCSDGACACPTGYTLCVPTNVSDYGEGMTWVYGACRSNGYPQCGDCILSCSSGTCDHEDEDDDGDIDYWRCI